MDEIDPVLGDGNVYAAGCEPSPFDKVLPEEPVQLSTQSKRITYQNSSGTTKVIALIRKNKYHQAIFRACVAGFESDWFTGISKSSKPSYFDEVRKFFDWINQSGYKTTSKTRYYALKDYETYQLNDRGFRSSPLGTINCVLREGLVCPALTSTDYDYLQTLLSLSNKVKSSKQQSVTLSSWFDLPWLRSVIGEQSYLKLESPSLLFKSFRVTVATTLLYLLEQRKRWQKSSSIAFKPSYTGWQYEWNRLLFERNGTFNKRGEPEGEFSQLLWLDFVKPSGQAALKERLAVYGNQNLPRRTTLEKKILTPWQKPVFFHPDYQTRYSALEETLCAWLVACEAIQPNDIPRLKTNNYASERNRFGRLIVMECTYYKGRSGTIKQPAILMGREPWTRAMDCYFKELSPSSHLFKTGVSKQKDMPTSKRSNEATLMFNIWRLPSFQQQLESELRQNEATSVFLHAMLALEHSDETFNQFKTRTGKTVDQYRALTYRLLPVSLFTLTHIKNTAVHAGSDVYREADLVNHHSHTSLTEKTSYLTDQNKEWIDQAGRITRLVLHDLQNVVFQPSITAISQAVNDKELSTQVIEATHTNDIVTHSLQSSQIEGDSDSRIIVSDTTDTALYFIHYITQAESVLPKLLAVRPDWIERTLIVQVEWMTRTLTRMRTASAAQKAYNKLEAHFPPLFDHLLETTE